MPLTIRQVENGFVIEEPRDIANDWPGKTHVFQELQYDQEGTITEKTVLGFLLKYFEE